jgi:hypothetical protein
MFTFKEKNSVFWEYRIREAMSSFLVHVFSWTLKALSAIACLTVSHTNVMF